MSDDPTSLSAITSIISNSKLEKRTQNVLINYIKQFDEEEYLVNFKLIKMLEAMLDSFPESEVEFIIFFIIDKFQKLYKLRPGFFLIRKLIKYCKNIAVQINIVKKIESCISSFPYTGNGSLLCQCLIRNFSVSEYRQKRSSMLASIESNINKMVNFKTNYKSKIKTQPEESYEEGEIEEDNQHHMKNAALSYFYDVLLNKILPLELNKHSSKVLECALKYGGSEFQDKFTQVILLINNEKHQSRFKSVENDSSRLLKFLISTERGEKFIRIALELMKPLNKKILESKIAELQSKRVFSELNSQDQLPKFGVIKRIPSTNDTNFNYSYRSELKTLYSIEEIQSFSQFKSSKQINSNEMDINKGNTFCRVGMSKGQSSINENI